MANCLDFENFGKPRKTAQPPAFHDQAAQRDSTKG